MSGKFFCDLKVSRESQAIIRRDKKVISRSSMRDGNFVLKDGKGCYLWDVEGRKYLDFAATIAVSNAGHANPEVLAAIRKQAHHITHAAFPDFYTELPVRFAETLLGCFPKSFNFSNVFLSNSGTESVEAAYKCARWHSQKKYVIAFNGCFHGRTMGSLSMTNSKKVQRERYGPFLPVKHVPYPYWYRMKMEPEECSFYCLDKLEKAIKKTEPAALFMEPIQGEGGYVVPPKSFVKGARKLCTKYDVLLCDDEVQAGAWRTGKFLAIENFSVRPDIVSMAKAIGGGLPLGATIASRRTMDWAPGSHSNTFGGNLVSCAAGIAALNYMKKKKLGKNAVNVGNAIMKRLEEMKEKYECIGDVRGIGLMIGFEIVKDKKSRQADKYKRDAIICKAAEDGLILLGAGQSVIRICPPLTIKKEQALHGMDIIERSIRRF